MTRGLSMFTLAALVGAVLFGTAVPAGAAKSSITLTVTPGPLAVLAAPCGGQPLAIDIANSGTAGAYVDVFITPEAPLITSHDVISTYVPPQRDVVVTAQISAPLGSAGGSFGVSVRAGSRGPSASSSAVVTPKPSGPGANLALGGPVSASSTHGNFAVCGGADGNTNSEHWDTLTGWNDGTSRGWTDTYASSTVGGAQPISRVVLYTLNSTRFPAARYGLKDFDIEVLDAGGKWVNMSSVRGNTAGVVEFTFD